MAVIAETKTVTETKQRQTYFVKAMQEAIAAAMREDPNVVVLGEDVERSVIGATRGLLDEFGPERLRNTPISEQAFVGAAIGAAAAGMRPVVDMMIEIGRAHV